MSPAFDGAWPPGAAYTALRSRACAYGWEVRLGAGASRADHGARFGPAPGWRSELAALAGTAPEGRGWRAVGRLAADPAVSHVFVELDAGPDPEPSVFAALADGSPAARRRAIELLAGAPPPGCIEAAIGALPADGRLLQLGAMLGRPGGAVRLFVALWKGHVADYLKAIGYPGDAARVAELHEAHADWCETAMLQLDAGDAIGARLGLELDAQAPTAALRHAEWRELLARLVAAGLCAPAKAHAVLAWRRAATATAPRRDVSHLKIVFDGRAAVEAKAYLFEERRGIGS